MLHTCLGRSFVQRSPPVPNVVGRLSQVTVLGTCKVLSDKNAPEGSKNLENTDWKVNV